jgi:hypothetical protein
MPPKRSVPLPGYAVSDEAAAYIADALMELALQFESAHFAQIRRHHQAIAQQRARDPALPGPSGKRRRSKSG